MVPCGFSSCHLLIVCCTGVFVIRPWCQLLQHRLAERLSWRWEWTEPEVGRFWSAQIYVWIVIDLTNIFELYMLQSKNSENTLEDWSKWEFFLCFHQHYHKLVFTTIIIVNAIPTRPLRKVMEPCPQQQQLSTAKTAPILKVMGVCPLNTWNNPFFIILTLLT